MRALQHSEMITTPAYFVRSEKARLLEFHFLLFLGVSFSEMSLVETPIAIFVQPRVISEARRFKVLLASMHVSSFFDLQGEPS